MKRICKPTISLPILAISLGALCVVLQMTLSGVLAAPLPRADGKGAGQPATLTPSPTNTAPATATATVTVTATATVTVTETPTVTVTPTAQPSATQIAQTLRCGEASGGVRAICRLVQPAASSVLTRSAPFAPSGAIDVVLRVDVENLVFSENPAAPGPVAVYVGVGATTEHTPTGFTVVTSSTLLYTATGVVVSPGLLPIQFNAALSNSPSIALEANVLLDVSGKIYLPLAMRDSCFASQVDCFERNDGFDSAYPGLLTRQAITASVAMGLDPNDFYRVSFTGTKAYTISVSPIGAPAGDLELVVYSDADRITPACRSTFTNDSTEAIYINRLPCSESTSSAGKTLPSGVYFIRVYLFTGPVNVRVPYVLQLSGG